MPDKIRWGILSTAGINQALLDPIRRSERSELAAVASRDPKQAGVYAAKHRIPKAHGSYETLLDDPDVDVIYNPLPNLLHAEWTVKAAQAGKHVLCEKPLTISMQQFDDVAAAAEANNVTIFEAFMYLHHPQTITAQEMIQEGRLGQVQLVQSWFNFYLSPENSTNIRLSAPLTGGSLWDVGVYPNSMAITMVGQGAPQSVYASQIVGETGVDVAMRGQLHFADGAVGQVSCGFRTPFREGAMVVGDEGILTIVEPWKPGLKGEPSVMRLTTRDGASEEIVTAPVDPYLCEVQAMEACILDGAEPLVTLDTSRTFLQSALAQYESAATGKAIELA